MQRLADGRRTVVSSDGGECPIWTPRGLHYQSGQSLMRATVIDDDRLSVGAVTKVADLGRASLRGVAADGALLVERGADVSRAHLVLATDWRRDLNDLLGPPAAALPR